MRNLEYHIGPTKNLTHLRLEFLRDTDYYNGPVRRAIARIANIPVIG